MGFPDAATAQHSESELRALESKSTPASESLQRHLTTSNAVPRSQISDASSWGRGRPETEAILHHLAEKVEEERRNRNAADECAKKLIQDLLVARSHVVAPEKDASFDAYTAHESELQLQLSSTSLKLAQSKALLKSTESTLARKVDENKKLAELLEATQKDLSRQHIALAHTISADDLKEHPSRDRASSTSTNPFDDDESFPETMARETKRLVHAPSECEQCKMLANRCQVKDQQLLELQGKYTSQKAKYHNQARTLKEHVLRLEEDSQTLRKNLAECEEELEDQSQANKSLQFASRMQSEEMRKQIKVLDLTTRTVSDLLKNTLKAQVLQAPPPKLGMQRESDSMSPPKKGMQQESDAVRLFADLQRRFLILQSEDASKKIKIEELERTICTLHGVLIEQETFCAQHHQDSSQKVRRKSVSFARELESPMKSLELSSVRGDDEVETAGDDVEFKFTQLERTIWSLQDTVHGVEQHASTPRKSPVAADESGPEAGSNSPSKLKQHNAYKDSELEKTRELLAEAQASYRSQRQVTKLQEEHIKNLRRTVFLHDRQIQEAQLQRNELMRTAEDLAARMALLRSENVSLWHSNTQLRQSEEHQQRGSERRRSSSRGGREVAEVVKDVHGRERSRGRSGAGGEVVDGEPGPKERRSSRVGREIADRETLASNREIENVKAQRDEIEVALFAAQNELKKLSRQFREKCERENNLLSKIEEQRIALDGVDTLLKNLFTTTQELEDGALFFLLGCNNLAGSHSSLRWRMERSCQVAVASARLCREMQEVLNTQARDITHAEAHHRRATPSTTMLNHMHSETAQMLDALSRTTDAVAELLKEALLRANWDGEAKSRLLQRQVNDMHHSYSQAVMQGVLESSEMLQMQATCTFVAEELRVKERLVSLLEDEMRDMHDKFQSLSRSSDRSRSEGRGTQHEWPHSPIAASEQSPAARFAAQERFYPADPSDSDASSQGLEVHGVHGVTTFQEMSSRMSPSMADGHGEALGRELVSACSSVDALASLFHAVSSACRLKLEFSAQGTDALSRNEQLPKLIAAHVLSLVDVTGYAVSSNAALSANLERFFQRQFQAWFAEVRELREQKKQLCESLNAVNEELHDVREVMNEIEQDSILEKDWQEFEKDRRRNRGIPNLPHSFYGTPSPRKQEARQTSTSSQTPPRDAWNPPDESAQTRSDEDAAADKLEIQRLELSLAQQINKNMELLDKMLQLSEAKDGMAAENQSLHAQLATLAPDEQRSNAGASVDFDLFDDS